MMSPNRKSDRRAAIRTLLVLATSLVAMRVAAAEKPVPNRETLLNFAVPGDCTWTPTGMRVKQGDRLSIEEEPGPDGRASSVRVRKGWPLINQVSARVTARGSYTLDLPSREFPLPAFVEDGRYPVGCLIGRIGENGKPFYVGPRYDGQAEASGELWLGINDPRPEHN